MLAHDQRHELFTDPGICSRIERSINRTDDPYRPQFDHMAHELVAQTEQTAGLFRYCRHIYDLVKITELVQNERSTADVILYKIASGLKRTDRTEMGRLVAQGALGKGTGGTLSPLPPEFSIKLSTFRLTP